MKKHIIIILTLFFTSITTPLWAGGLRMNYAEVLVQNLQIGSNYSMIKLVNLPLKVTNHSDSPIDIQLEILTPKSKIKEDFEPIPDTAWIELGETLAEVPANGVYETDVKISIPDEEKYLGKKYQVNIKARIKPKGGGMRLALAVQGRLLFTVAAVKQAGVADKAIADLGFVIDPLRVDLTDVLPGKKVEILTEDKKSVTLENPGKKKIRFTLQSLDPKDTVMSIEPGFEACPNPDFLTIKKDEMSVGAGRKKPVKMFIEIPDSPEHKGKKYQFIVSINTGTATSGARYLRIMVSTAKE